MIELIIAVMMVSVSVVTVSLIFPKASATMTNNRRHWLASNFAATRIQELKEKPYTLIPTTQPGAAGNYFTSIAQAAGGCDCNTLITWTTLPDLNGAVQPDAIFSEDGITYSRQVCIHLVNKNGAIWDSFCPDNPMTSATDKGLKNIRVRVSWTAGNKSDFTDVESMVTR